MKKQNANAEVAVIETPIEATGIVSASRPLASIEKMFSENGGRLSLNADAKSKVTSDDFAAYIQHLHDSSSKAGSHMAFLLYEASLIGDEMFKTTKAKLGGIPASRLDVLTSMARKSIPYAIKANIDLSKVAIDTVYNAQAAVWDTKTGKTLDDSTGKTLLALMQSGTCSQGAVKKVRDAAKAGAKAALAAKEDAEKAKLETPEAKAKREENAKSVEYATALASAKVVQTYLAKQTGGMNEKEGAAFIDAMHQIAISFRFTVQKIAPKQG